MSDREGLETPLAARRNARGSDALMFDAGCTRTAAGRDAVSRDPVDSVVCRIADGSCAAAHTRLFNPSRRGVDVSAQHSLLRLQRRYGNTYVARVLSQAATGGKPAHEFAGIERSIDTMRGSGSGSGMEHGTGTGTRTRKENVFDTDFSGVRIFADSRADLLSRSLSAHAFTSGSDVFCQQSEYSPDTSTGQGLLAHEFTDVVQQGATTFTRADSLSAGPGPDVTRADTGLVQRDWLDDAKAVASDAYDSAAATVSAGYSQVASTVSSAYDSAASTVSAGVQAVAEGAKAAAATVSGAGQAVGSYASDIGKTVSKDPEKTRTELIGRVNSAKQKMQATDPDSIHADASQIASINQHVSSLNLALAPAAVPLVPVLVPEAPALGAGLAGILEAIALALGISVGWVIVIIAVIVLALIALIIYLLRDTRKYPEDVPKGDPKAKEKHDTKGDPKQKPKEEPEPDGPWPIPGPDVLPPDCCQKVFPPSEFTTDKRHRRFPRRTIRVLDGRGKHTRNVKSNSPGASCDVEYLESILQQQPAAVGPCLRAWMTAAATGDTDVYGGQLGSDSAPQMKEIVKEVLDSGEEIRRSDYWGDAGMLVGVDVTTGKSTTKAHIKGLPDEAHVIPAERRPTL
jgi:Domain of unknown function (DUF4157)